MYEFQYLFQYLAPEGWVTFAREKFIDARVAGEYWAYITYQIGATPGIWDNHHQRILGPDPRPAVWPPHNCGYCRENPVFPEYVCTTPPDFPWWRKKGGQMLAMEKHYNTES
jgi:hypothetical protein